MFDDFSLPKIDTSGWEEHSPFDKMYVAGLDNNYDYGQNDFNKQASGKINQIWNNLGAPSTEDVTRPYHFNSEQTQFDRYQNSDYFKELGFVPWAGKDNEYKYSQAQTWGNTLKQAASGAWKLALSVGKEQLYGWARLGSALYNWDVNKLNASDQELYDLNKEQQDIFNKNAIFASPYSESHTLSRQFLGNSIQQLGFTVGALGEFVFENALAGAIGKGIASAAGVGMKAVDGVNAAKTSLGEVSVLLKDAMEVKNPTVWNTILKGAEKIPIIDEFAKTGDEIYKTAKVGKLVGAETSTIAKQSALLGLGGLRRAYSEFNMARSESVMESATTYGNVYSTLKNEYINNNGGAEPTGKDLEDILSSAHKAAKANFWSNTAVISISNKLAFDNIIDRYASSKRLIRGLEEAGEKDIINVTAPLKSTGEIGTVAYKKGFTTPFKIAKDFGFGRALWEGANIYRKSVLGKLELTEGLQEILQDVSNNSITNYYISQYHGVPETLKYDLWNSFKGEFSKNGFETFLMGATTGMFLFPFASALKSGVRLATVSNLKELKTNAKKEKEENLNLLNQFYKDPNKILNPHVANYFRQNKLAEDIKEAIENNTPYVYHNKKGDAFASLINTAIKTDSIGNVLDTIEKWSKTLSDEEFQKAFNLEATTTNRQKIDKLSRNITEDIVQYHENWNELKDKYSSYVMPELYKEGTEEHKQAKIAKRALDEAIEILATTDYKAKTAISRSVDLHDKAAALSTIGSSVSSAFRILGTESLIDKEILLLNSEINAKKALISEVTSTKEDKEDLQNKETTLSILQKFKERFNSLDNLEEAKKLEEGKKDELIQAFNDFIKIKNKEAGVNVPVVKEDDVRQAYIYLNDYIKLNKDHEEYVQAFNLISNPTNFVALHDKLSRSIFTAMQTLHNQALDRVERIDTPPTETSNVDEEKTNEISNAVKETINYSNPVTDANQNTLKTEASEDNEEVRKHPEYVFNSTTSTRFNRLSDAEERLKDIVKREKAFSSRIFKLMKDRNFQVISFSKNNEDKIGLTGISKILFTTEDAKKYADGEQPLFEVVVEKDENDNLYFINYKGERSKQISDPNIDFVNDVVVYTRPSPTLEYVISGYGSRFQEVGFGENWMPLTDAQKKKLLEDYRRERETKLSSIYNPLDDIRSFIPHYGGGFILSDDLEHSVNEYIPSIKKDEQVIFISTSDKGITVDGKTYKPSVGYPVLISKNLNGNTSMMYLKSKNLGDQNAEVAYEIIKKLAEELESGKTFTEILNTDEAKFLRNLVYFNSPRKDSNGNYVFSTNNIHLSSIKDRGAVISFGKPGEGYEYDFNLSSIEENRNDIISKISSMKNTINKQTLDKVNEPFTYYNLNSKGELVTGVEDNYQTFLINGFNDTKFLYSNDAVLKTDEDYNAASVYLSFADAKHQMPVEVTNASATTTTTVTENPTYIAILSLSNPNVNQGAIVYSKIVEKIPGEEYAPLRDTLQNLLNEFKAKQADNSSNGTIDQDILNSILIGYAKKQQAALRDFFPPIVEEPEVPPTKPDTQTSEEDEDEEAPFSIADIETTEPISQRDIEIFKEWHQKNLPLMPFEILSQLVTMKDGRKAWGVFEKGVAKFFIEGKKGTQYHEIFHGIWKLVVNENDKESIYDELRNRTGKFYDRLNRTWVEYGDGTNYQLEEVLADEFANYRENKINKPLSQKIIDFFRNLIRLFFNVIRNRTESNKVRSLFENIDRGTYKETPIKLKDISIDDTDSRWSVIDGKSPELTNKYVLSSMLACFRPLLENKKDLMRFGFEITNIQDFLSPIDTLYSEKLSKEGLKQLKQKVVDRFITLGVKAKNINLNDEELDLFDEDDKENDDKDVSGIKEDAFKTSEKSKASPIMKLFTNIIPKFKISSKGAKVYDKIKEDDTEFYQIQKGAEIFAKMLSVFDKTNPYNIEKQYSKLYDETSKDFSLAWIYHFLMKGNNVKDFKSIVKTFSIDDWRFLIQHYGTFNLQKPVVLRQEIGDDGQVYITSGYSLGFITNKADKWKRIIKYNVNSETKEALINEIKSSRNNQQLINILSQIGLTDFDIQKVNDMSNDDKELFRNLVVAIFTVPKNINSIIDAKNSTYFNKEVNSKISLLSQLWAKIHTGDTGNMHLSSNGERRYNYAQHNYPSTNSAILNDVQTKEELYDFIPGLRDDVNAKNSVILNGVQEFKNEQTTETVQYGGLFDKEGNKRNNVSIEYTRFDGEYNKNKKRGNTSKKLSETQEYTLAINAALNGIYLFAGRGTSSSIYGFDLSKVLGFDNSMFNNALEGKSDKLNKILSTIIKGYYEDDVALAGDTNRKYENIGKRAGQLRLFNDFVKKENGKFPEWNNDIYNQWNDQMSKFTIDLYNYLIDIGVINETSDDFVRVEGITSDLKIKVTKELNEEDSDEVSRFYNKKDILNALNYVIVGNYIAQTEYQKVFLGDPFQFAEKNGITEIFKRIQSFISPKDISFDHPDFNEALGNEYNKGLSEGMPGWIPTESTVKMVTLDKLMVEPDVYWKDERLADLNEGDILEEADAATFISPSAYLSFALRNKSFLSNEQIDYVMYNLAKSRVDLYNNELKDEAYKWSDELKAKDEALVESYEKKFKEAKRISILNSLKPIITGSELNRPYIHTHLVKTAMTGLFWTYVNHTKAGRDMYIKMYKENIHIYTFKSAHKLGTEKSYPLYGDDGNINTESFIEGSQDIPWRIISNQVEQPLEKNNIKLILQANLLATIGSYDNGQVLNEKTQRTVEKYRNAQANLREYNYRQLIKNLGLQEKENGELEIIDLSDIREKIIKEINRLGIYENATDSLKLDEDGKKFLIAPEASASIVTIKNILDSLVTASIVKPSLKGKHLVNTPATGWENNSRQLLKQVKTENGKFDYIPVTRDQIEKGDVICMSSSELKFTKEGKMQVYVNPSFIRGIKGKFNIYTEEGRKELFKAMTPKSKEHFAARIPLWHPYMTEVIEIAGFIDPSMGDVIIVPSAITKKTGSDFDVDKLSTYLKHLYVNENGKVDVIPSNFKSEELAREYWSNKFDNNLAYKIQKTEEIQRNKEEDVEEIYLKLKDSVDASSSKLKNIIDKVAFINEWMQEEQENLIDDIKELIKKNKQLNDTELQKDLKELFVDRMVRAQYENAYNQSLIDMMLQEHMFVLRFTPNTTKNLERIEEKITGGKRKQVPQVTNFNTLVSQTRLYTALRRSVGIIAKAITFYGSANATGLSINFKKNKETTDWKILIPHNEGPNGTILLGKEKNVANKYIADQLGEVGSASVDAANNDAIGRLIYDVRLYSLYTTGTIIGMTDEDLSYLFHQPIIKEFLNRLNKEREEYINLNKKSQQEIISEYITGDIDYKEFENVSLNKEYMSPYINKDWNSLNKEEANKQQIIFDQFLKLITVSDHLRDAMMATDFAARKATSSELTFRREYALSELNNGNIIDGIDNLLNNTDLYIIQNLSEKARVALGKILHYDRGTVLEARRNNLLAYIRNKFLNEEDYSTIALKQINSITDFLINNSKEIVKLSDVDFIEQWNKNAAKYNATSNYIALAENKKGQPLLVLQDIDVYDDLQREIAVNAMRELKKTDEDFYNNVISKIMLQGSSSVNDIIHIVPAEDFAKIVETTLENIDDYIREWEASKFFQIQNLEDDKIVPKYEFWLSVDTRAYSTYVKGLTPGKYLKIKLDPKYKNNYYPVIKLNKYTWSKPSMDIDRGYGFKKRYCVNFDQQIDEPFIIDYATFKEEVQNNNNPVITLKLLMSQDGSQPLFTENGELVYIFADENGQYKDLIPTDVIRELKIDTNLENQRQKMLSFDKINVPDAEENMKASIMPTVGNYIVYNNQNHIVTKINKDGTIQILNPLTPGTKGKKTVNLESITVTRSNTEIVTYKNSQYIITPENKIISVKNNKEMPWKKDNQMRIDVLRLANREEMIENQQLIDEMIDKIANNFEDYSRLKSNVEEFKGNWTREEVKNQPDKLFLFGDNTNDRINTKYIPSSTQAVIRGLPNAIGIDTKKDRGTNEGNYKWSRYSDNSYEVSSAGDTRFSALSAKLKDGRTIEEAYQLDIKGYRSQGNDWKLGKGKSPIRNITKEQQWEEYKQLWKTYLNENPELLKDLQEKAKNKVLTDKFASTDISQAKALAEILNEKTSSYFTDADFDQFKTQVDEAIQQAKDSGKIIVIPEGGIGTGKAMLKEKAPKLFNYLQQELNKLTKTGLSELNILTLEDLNNLNNEEKSELLKKLCKL